MESYVHKGIFRTKSNIYDGAFFTSVKPYFKNVLNSIELPLGCIFYTTHSFIKTLRTSGESLLLTIDQFFFFKIRNYAMECRHQ